MLKPYHVDNLLSLCVLYNILLVELLRNHPKFATNQFSFLNLQFPVNLFVLKV